MNTKTNRTGLKTILLSLIVMALWGSLYPFIKIGYEAFGIDGTSIAAIIMFASFRFMISGAAVCSIALAKNQPLESPKFKSIGGILLMGLFSIVLHYTFTYIGMATTDSSKTALIKQLGSLLYVCFAFVFFKSEKFSILKIAGALMGFCGIFALNFNPKGISFSSGDILIILASFCTVTANIIVKKTPQGTSPFWVTGISQLAGGIVLFIAALVMGADLPVFTWRSTAVFAYICTASITAYTLWYSVLRTNSLSKMMIIKFAEPLFACIFSAILLGEDIFKLQYLAAFLLISMGILLGNKSEQK